MIATTADTSHDTFALTEQVADPDECLIEYIPEDDGWSAHMLARGVAVVATHGWRTKDGANASLLWFSTHWSQVGIHRLRRLRDAEQRHPRQLPVQATGGQTRAVSRRPLDTGDNGA